LRSGNALFGRQPQQAKHEVQIDPSISRGCDLAAGSGIEEPLLGDGQLFRR
jgi:hypothetical protein